MTSFADLGLSQKVLSAVTDAGYTTPTPIQMGAIPHALQRRDICGIAQTGTGKTASFVLPMLTLLEKGRARARMPRTLILEPTRELAAQVAENFEKYGKNHKLNVALLIGGVSFDEQDRKLERGADVLICTPGRLLDHCERGKLLMTGVEILVIDEADRMLDMGFIPDIERIAKMIPFTRQTLFFSATMPPEIQKLADRFLQNPERIEVAKPSSTAATVTQRLVASHNKDYEKRAVLRDLIRAQDDLKNAIIFCNRKRDVADLFRSLVGVSRIVAAQARTTALHRMETEDYVSALLETASGAPATLITTTAAYPGYPERIEITGSKGYASLIGGRLRLAFLDGREEIVEAEGSTGSGANIMDFPHDAHRAVIADFLDAIDEGRDPVVTGEEALASQRLVDAVLAAARNGA